VALDVIYYVQQCVEKQCFICSFSSLLNEYTPNLAEITTDQTGEDVLQEVLSIRDIARNKLKIAV